MDKHKSNDGDRSPAIAPRAFTLVELLVVIVIISMLMALLLPAVVGSRVQARITECANHQKNIAMAVVSYETAKKHLPGFANQLGPNGNIVSWVPVLFPFLDKNDLWKGNYSSTPPIPGWRSGAGGYPYINDLVCPSDVTDSGAPTLSYVVSCGLYNDAANPYASLVPGSGVFRNYSGGSGGAISFSDVSSKTQTVMISERIDPQRIWSTVGNPSDNSLPVPTYLPTQPGSPPLVNVGFLWPDSTSTISPELGATLIGETLERSGGGVPLEAPLPAIHPGIVVVAFCDGHVEKLPLDTPCNLYRGSVD